MKKIGMIFAIGAIGVILTGCATVRHQAIDAKASASLQGQTVTYTVRKKPDFVAFTAAKVLIPIVGALAMVSEGNNIISTNNVDDPARFISLGLMKSLESASGSQITGSPANVDGSDVEQIIASAQNARFIVDVQTIGWQFVYFSTNWNHYRVNYSAKARLIDTQSKQVIAESACSRMPPETSNAPTYDELVLNGAAGLKRELAVAANECLDLFRTGMLAQVGSANRGVTAATVSAITNNQPTTYSVLAAPAVEQSGIRVALVSGNPVTAVAPVEVTVMPATPLVISNNGAQNTNTKIQMIEFRQGVSSVTVEKLAKKYGCVGGKGAGLITPQGPVEVYRMACDNGRTFMAKCEMRQCSAMR